MPFFKGGVWCGSDGRLWFLAILSFRASSLATFAFLAASFFAAMHEGRAQCSSSSTFPQERLAQTVRAAHLQVVVVSLMQLHLGHFKFIFIVYS
jgi:hypothetical protein